MINFCTLFDSNYLTRGLAMYYSLVNHCSQFHLFIFAFDNKTYDILKKLSLEKITVISLKEFENDELLAIKPTRSKAEYCWTCTPSTIEYVISKYNVESCTYIDSDLFFYANPTILFEEMGDNSIMITEHRYPKLYNRSNLAGKYCVQFITFKNDINGLQALKWWQNSCNEWCYNRYEDGKFGDQKYLDDWLERFKGVHVMQHLGGGLAPWNIMKYKLLKYHQNKIELRDKKSLANFNAIFYHYHYVRFYKKGLMDLGWFIIPRKIVKTLYFNYVIQLKNIKTQVLELDKDFVEDYRPFSIQDSIGLKNKIKFYFKILTRFNLFRIDKFN